MPTFTITYLPGTGLLPERADADSADVEASGVWIVLRRAVVVVGTPRDVVVRRVRASDVLSVEPA